MIMPVNIFSFARKIGETLDNKNYNMWAVPNSFYFFE